MKDKYGFAPRYAACFDILNLLYSCKMSRSCLENASTLTYIWFSERKYKEKLKDWKFEKYLDATGMNFIAAKDESRARDQEKTTAFYNRGIKISSQRIEGFKKRTKQQVDKMETPPAGKENDNVMSASHSNIVTRSNPSKHYIPYAASRKQQRPSPYRANQRWSNLSKQHIPYAASRKQQ
jgi:hypothetical protein